MSREDNHRVLAQKRFKATKWTKWKVILETGCYTTLLLYCVVRDRALFGKADQAVLDLTTSLAVVPLLYFFLVALPRDWALPRALSKDANLYDGPHFNPLFGLTVFYEESKIIREKMGNGFYVLRLTSLCVLTVLMAYFLFYLVRAFGFRRH